MNQVYCSDPLFKVFLFASLSKIHRNQNLIKKTKTKSIQQPQNLLKKSWIFVFFHGRVLMTSQDDKQMFS